MNKVRRKQLQKLRTEILDVSMEAFAREGIKAVTMDRIAEMLSISKRTLYEMFRDKETLLLEGFAEYHRKENEEFATYARNNTNILAQMVCFYKKKVDDLGRVNPAFFEEIKKFPSVVAFLQQKRKTDTECFVQVLKLGVEQDLFRQDINFEIVRFFLDALDLLARNFHARCTPLDVVKSILLVWVRGVCTQKGIDFLDSFLYGMDKGENDILKK